MITSFSLRAFVAVFVLAGILSLSSVLTSAQAAEPLRIAIVDVEKIFSEAKASKSLQQQINKRKESFQKEFSDREKELKVTEDSLMIEREKITAEEFAIRRKAYEEKVMETRKLFQKRRNSLDEGLTKAMQELRRNLVESAAAVATEKNFDIILTRESVLIAEKEYDITADVLKKIDANVSNISLNVE